MKNIAYINAAVAKSLIKSLYTKNTLDNRPVIAPVSIPSLAKRRTISSE